MDISIYGDKAADRCRLARGELFVYVRYVLEVMLPTFNDVEQEAEEAADAYLTSVGYQPLAEDAEADRDIARGIEHNHSEMMARVEQSILNLSAVGLFHRLEQLLSDIIQNGSAATSATHHKKSGNAISFCGILKRYAGFEKLPSWSRTNELRLVANVAKHAEGDSAEKLRRLNPELFSSAGEVMGMPLLGDDLFVSAQHFKGYAEAADSLLEEMAQHFDANADQT